MYTALFCYVLELQLLDGSAYNKELAQAAVGKNGHSPSAAQLTNLEKEKKGSQCTRKRRVACPFHLVYQATYRYIMQPPTRVISSLDYSETLLRQWTLPTFHFSFYFQSRPPNHRPLSLELLQVLFRFTDFARSPPK